MRTRAWRRSQRQRFIARRLEHIRNVWFRYPEQYTPWMMKFGRFSKYNLVCSCGMCRAPKYARHRTDWTTYLD